MHFARLVAGGDIGATGRPERGLYRICLEGRCELLPLMAQVDQLVTSICRIPQPHRFVLVGGGAGNALAIGRPCDRLYLVDMLCIGKDGRAGGWRMRIDGRAGKRRTRIDGSSIAQLKGGNTGAQHSGKAEQRAYHGATRWTPGSCMRRRGLWQSLCLIYRGGRRYLYGRNGRSALQVARTGRCFGTPWLEREDRRRLVARIFQSLRELLYGCKTLMWILCQCLEHHFFYRGRDGGIDSTQRWSRREYQLGNHFTIRAFKRAATAQPLVGNRSQRVLVARETGFALRLLRRHITQRSGDFLPG